jgi:hypothetical protein
MAETLLSKEEKEAFCESSLGTVSHPSPAIRPHCPLLAGQSGVQIECAVEIECEVQIQCAAFSVKNKYSEQCAVYKCAVITTFLAASLPRSNNLITGSAKRVTYCPLPTGVLRSVLKCSIVQCPCSTLLRCLHSYPCVLLPCLLHWAMFLLREGIPHRACTIGQGFILTGVHLSHGSSLLICFPPTFIA